MKGPTFFFISIIAKYSHGHTKGDTHARLSHTGGLRLTHHKHLELIPMVRNILRLVKSKIVLEIGDLEVQEELPVFAPAP